MKKHELALTGLLLLGVLISSAYVQIARAPIQIVGIVMVSAVAVPTAAYIAAYGFSSIYPLASDTIDQVYRRFGWQRYDDRDYVILMESNSAFEDLLDAIRDELQDKVIEILKKALSKGWSWWITTIRIGADASPNANPFNPKFVYKNYRVGSYVSRWDFYPPGSWTINQWIVDMNEDGRADFVVSWEVKGFYLK